jgi:hypothetical protein
MKKPLVVGGAVVVLAGLGGLLYSMRGGKPQASESPPAKQAQDDPGRQTPRERAPDAAAGTDLGPEPVEPDVPEPDPTKTVRRDHRNSDEPIPPPPSIIGPSINALRAAAMPRVKTCTAPLRTMTPPQKGRIFVTLTARAAGGKVTITHAELKPLDLDAPDVVDCVRRAFEETVVDAPEGQGDGEHAVAMNLNVP